MSARLASLRWVVECRAAMGGWETIAAFNVDRVAARYARDCSAANLSNAYRVVELPEPCEPVDDWTVTHKFSRGLEQ